MERSSLNPPPLLLENSHLPTHYDLSLQLDHTKPNFSGKVLIPLVKNQHFSGQHDHFQFSLNCNKIVITKALLKLSTQDEPISLLPKLDKLAQRVTFNLTDPHPQNLDPVSIDITFLGSIKTIQTYQDATYGLFKTNYSDSIEGKSDNYIIATHTQPYGCRTIFPCVDELTVKVPIALSITTNNRFKAVSNAVLKSKSHIEMTDTMKHVFDETPPIATSVFGFVVGDLEEIEELSTTEAKTPVRIITTKGDSSMARYALHATSTLLPYFERVLGVPYPLPKLDIVGIPFLSDWVMENWGMITLIKDGLLLNEHHASDAAKHQLRQILAHQLTHQWIGNLITFDEWKYMWLTESMATFLGDYVLSLASLESSDADSYNRTKTDLVETSMDTDCFHNLPIPSLHEHMNEINTGLDATTGSLFEKSAYDKGMIILNMVATQMQIENNSKDIAPFFAAFKEAFGSFQYKTIKPHELWSIVNEKTTFDVLTFIHSWTRYAGFPCIQVREKNGGLHLTQHRFLYNEDVNELGLEDPPFYIPLSMKVVDDKGGLKHVSLMLSDRSMDLEIKPHQLVSINENKQFYYKTVYDSSLRERIVEKVSNNLLTSLDQIGLIQDCGKILGQASKEEEKDVFGKHQLLFLMKLMDAFSRDTWKVDYSVLKVALSYLEIVNNVMVHFSPYVKFENWLDDLASRLMNKLGDWEKIVEQTSAQYDATEFEVRNTVLQMASNQKESQGICKRLYKSFVNSGVTHKFVPKELFSSMLNVTVAQSNMSEYKQVLALVKNANVSYLKHTNGTSQELQTAAVASLGFARKPELLQKTLHFVNTNIDSKMIELALLGLKYQPDNGIKQMVWAWYNVNYEQWVKRSLYKESKWAKQIGVTVLNISKIILGEVMACDKKAVNGFINSKVGKLPPHKFQETWDQIREEVREKEAIASFYDDVVGQL